jgi:hypothetical protein
VRSDLCRFVVLDVDVEGQRVAVNAMHVTEICDAVVVGQPGPHVQIVTLKNRYVVRGSLLETLARFGFVDYRPGTGTGVPATEHLAPAADEPHTVRIAPDGYPFQRGVEPQPDPSSDAPLSSPEALACLRREPAQRPALEVIEHVLTALTPAQLNQVMADTAGMDPKERPYACLVRACECNYLDWNTIIQ